MAKSKKSGFASQMGKVGNKAMKSVRGEDTDFGKGGDLPAGITGGVARLSACYFKQYKTGDMKGKYFFAAQAVVVSPKEFKGMKIEGLQTRIGPEPLCETPNRQSRPTFESHLGWVLNELRKLGLDTSDLDFDELEDAMNGLVEAAPYFTFRTWVGKATKQYPDPQVNSVWSGECSFDGGDDDDDDGVEDDTEDDDDEDETAEVEDDDDDDDEVEPSDEDSLASLTAKADADDEKAQEILTKRADDAGVDAEDFDTWGEVVAAIEAASSDDDDDDDSDDDDDEDDDEDNDENAIPEKGDTVQAKPHKKKKFAEYEVTKVTKGKQTCTLKGDDGRLYKSVPWDRIKA